MYPVFYYFSSDKAFVDLFDFYFLTASQASVSIASSQTPNKVLGDRSYAVFKLSPYEVPISQFKSPSKRLAANININGVLDLQLFTALTYLFYGPSLFIDYENIDLPDVLQIGENIYPKTYLQNSSLSIRPFEPINYSASFVSYESISDNGITGRKYPSDGNFHQGSTDYMPFGHTCYISGDNTVIPDMFAEIDVKLTLSLTPRYSMLNSGECIGVFVDGIEKEMTIKSTGLSQFLTDEGPVLTRDLGLILVTSAGVTGSQHIIMSAGSVYTAQTLEFNDTLMTSATISEIVV